jgi:hypothetical protein
MLLIDKSNPIVFCMQAGHNASLTTMLKVGGCPTDGWVWTMCLWEPETKALPSLYLCTT